MKNYTKDWNHWFILNTRGINNLDLCLEIGCFEGATSNYIVENLLSPSGKLVCVDPLKDSYLVEDLDEEDERSNSEEFHFFKDQKSRFFENTQDLRNSGKIILHEKSSFLFYEDSSSEYLNSFDFIYIDGDHRPDSVYKDGIKCFDLCKEGGLILFDDYEWRSDVERKSTKSGIDRFLEEYNGRYREIKKNYQILIEKIK